MYPISQQKPVPAHAGFQYHSAGAPSSQQQHHLTPAYSQPAYQGNRTSSATLQYSHPGSYAPQSPQRPPQAFSSPTALTVPARKLSNATMSTTSTGGHYQTYSMSNSSEIHRSSSARSANQQFGYVAMMRRQKGTVWCDHAQPEDPRLQAQKRAAKQRAYLELQGATNRSGTGSGKIRHHSGKGTAGFASNSLVGQSVPVRLSANEVGDDDDDIPRTNSGRSSMGSIKRYPSGYQRPSAKTPPSEHENIPEVAENAPTSESKDTPSKTEPAEDTAAQQENDFGDVGDLGAPSAADTAMQRASTADELRRRGSVDERTTSLTTGVRLFVANPDVD